MTIVPAGSPVGSGTTDGRKAGSMVRGAGACTLARRFAGANIACDVARRGGGAGATRMDAGRRSCAAHCASMSGSPLTCGRDCAAAGAERQQKEEKGKEAPAA